MPKKSPPRQPAEAQPDSDRVAAVADLIMQRHAPPRAERLLALHQLAVVRAPYTPLFEDDAERIAEVLTAALEVMERRRDLWRVELLPLAGGRGHLLVSNCPDAPFLFASIQNYLRGAEIHFQVLAHPILGVVREEWELIELVPLEDAVSRESLILIEVDFIPEGLEVQIPRELAEIVRQAQQSATDQQAMLAQLRRLAQLPQLEAAQPLLEWLESENFNLFGYRPLECTPQGEVSSLRGALGTCPEDGSPPRPGKLERLQRPLRSWLRRESPLLVEQSPWSSRLNRLEPLIYLGLRESYPGGGWREHGFYGLFTPQSVDQPAVDVPYLRLKIEAALETMAIQPGSYDWRLSLEILNTFPKVELYLMSAEELCRVVHSFLSLQRRGAVRVIPARHLSLEGVALLVVLPKEFYSSENRRRLESYLCRAFHSERAELRLVHVYGEFFSLLVRLLPKGRARTPDPQSLEGVLTRLLQGWDTKLLRVLERQCGIARGQQLWRRIVPSLDATYRRMVHPRFAARDVSTIDRLLKDGRTRFDLWGPRPGSHDYVLQFYAGKQCYLNELMPLLENLGLCVVEEVDFNLSVGDESVYLKSFVLHDSGGPYTLGGLRARLLQTLDALWHGGVENDYLHLLQLRTGLDWYQVDVFRGYRHYYFRLGAPFTKKRVAFALIHNPQVARLLSDYFTARFEDRAGWRDPSVREEQALMPLRLQLVEALEQVQDVNEDRILRVFFNLIDSTVRTSFFRRRGRDEYFFAFKISALGIIDMPFPRPQYEIYVHSAHMEGIHLRGGRVARGGIRWSDRPDDFRTEILGLMKTQMTKNTVIVPVGSKGGFVVKTPFRDREEGGRLSREAYVTLMRGLLDLTDNHRAGEIEHPQGVVSYDGDDPYLVVAADKGTAQFSDTANGVATDYGFWLGDAFASGGSHGYDHKQLGITARGAWECVKRHFRELGRDIQREPFTVVGIGDMSGDVFGNGMLLSPCIRLRAAFDHRHIFIDPDPDPEGSFAERRRLFALARSSWDDYDRTLISSGGGIWSRSSKEIPLSREVRDWLGVRHTSLDGDGLIRLLLCAETDLLWNGGIGTYVKSGSEKHEEAGDRANDAVRVDASQLKARVVGEGGNLGFTQRGRIEYALGGGRINTDAIDNSAGVDTSDHEVNLKILMQHLLESERVASVAERDRLLTGMTEEVCTRVLRNNYSQSLCLSLDAQRCRLGPERFFDLADRLVNAGLLDRQGESLPGRKEVLARETGAFTRPELSILLAYTKMHLYHALLESELAVSDAARALLRSYFPLPLQEAFGEELERHPLAREIAATVITNRVVDQAGCTAMHLLARESGVELAACVEAYLAFEALIGAEVLRETLFDLDNRIDAALQYELLLLLEEGLRSLCRGYFDRRAAFPRERLHDAMLQEALATYLKDLPGILTEEERQRREELQERMSAAGFPADREMAPFLALLHLGDFLPLVQLAERSRVDLYSAAGTLMEVRRRFEVPFLAEALARVPLRDHWDRVAFSDLERSFEAAVYRAVERVLVENQGNLDAFINHHRRRVSTLHELCARLRTTTPLNLHPLAVCVRALEALHEA